MVLAKIKTNLTPAELESFGKQILELSKSQNKVVLDNAAEKELLRRAEFAFNTMLESLRVELSKLLLEK